MLVRHFEARLREADLDKCGPDFCGVPGYYWSFPLALCFVAAGIVVMAIDERRPLTHPIVTLCRMAARQVVYTFVLLQWGTID